MANTIARKEINEALNGVEIYFTTFPIKATRDNLKANGFRWNHKKACWYARRSELTEAIADTCADTTTEEYKQFASSNGEEVKEATKKATKKETKKAEKSNKFGVKVGDFFHMSWGYEQTNNDFFQVVELVGTTSVRIREVNPPIISRSSEGYAPMAEDRVYKLDTSVILPPATGHTFIKDQEKGDLKRLKSYAADGISNPQINMTSYADAYYCGTDTLKAYESWYY